MGEVLREFGRNDSDVAEDLVIGIDGGGSTTVALIADATEVIGRAEAGPSNMQAVGVTRALKAIEDAIAAAFAAAGRPPAKVRVAVLGLAGADRPQEQDLVRTWAERFGLATQVQVVNDGATVTGRGHARGMGHRVGRRDRVDRLRPHSRWKDRPRRRLGLLARR